MVATVTRLKAAATTVHYFEVDGYYAKNDPEHRKASRWHGEAAALLGLQGRVNPKRFEAVLAGYVPGTELRLGRLRDGEHQHRPGVDVTFSAPKSVSLEALVYAAPKSGARVLRAHDEAVRATLGFIETELLQTRSYDPQTGRRPRVQADGMVAATFRHLASRNLDPQLHTHAVIANMTRGRDGDWRSAEFTLVERSKLLIGAYYRNELRTRLEEIGYATVPTLVGRMPGFEIAGYQRPMLDAFSTRRRELLDYMADRGWENTPARTQQAALYTRQRKAEPERQVLHETWQERAREIGPARDRDRARGRNGARVASPQSEARAPPSALSVVRRAVEHLEERRTVFSANDLRAWALAHGGGRHSLEALDAGIAQLRRDGHLIEAKARRADLAFVTDRARNAERDIIAGMRAGLDAGRSLAPEAAVEAGLEEAGLNPGQRDAARTILLSSHRTIGVQGHAGSGKTTMLRTVRELAGEHRIVGLAPSASAVHVLAGEADIPARTLQGFLTRYRDVGDGIADAGEDGRSPQGPGRCRADPRRGVDGRHDPDAGIDADRGEYRGWHGAPRAHRRPSAAARGGGRPALRPAAGRRDAHGPDGRGGAPARRGPQRRGPAHGGGRAAHGGGRAGQGRPGDGERRARQEGGATLARPRSGPARRHGDPGAHARAQGRDQHRRPPRPGGRGRAARPRAGDRALRQPAPDALAEGRGQRTTGRATSRSSTTTSTASRPGPAMPAAFSRRRTMGACCWPIPTAKIVGSTRPATSATGSTSTRPGRWCSGPATMCAGPATILAAA